MGATTLSRVEKEILDELLVSEPKAIAQHLGLAESTVYHHIKNVRRKYKNAKTFSNIIDAKYRSHGLGKYLWIKDVGRS